MGGGSDYGYSGTAIENATEANSSKVSINELLEGFVKDMQISKEQLEMIRSNVEKILLELKKYDIDVEDISWEGSFSKKTYVEGLSDIDFIISLGTYSESGFEYKENSKLALEKLKDIVSKRFPNTEVKVGNMAVTVTFSDGTELQFLPGFKYYEGYSIPDPKSNGWITTFPKRFKDKLTDANQKLNGKFKPIIRLIKNLFDKNGIELSSYHIENLALSVLKDYKGPYTYSAMLLGFLNGAKVEIGGKLPDISEQSRYVDDYLGDAGSPTRKAYARKIKAIEAKLLNYNREDWNDSFE